jgi:adenine-specific DNA-methyltransferase
MYRHQDGDRIYRLDNLTSPKGYTERPNTYYPIHDPETDTWYPCNPDCVWRFFSKHKLKPGQKTPSDTMEELVEKKLIWFPPNSGLKSTLHWTPCWQLLTQAMFPKVARHFHFVPICRKLKRG